LEEVWSPWVFAIKARLRERRVRVSGEFEDEEGEWGALNTGEREREREREGTVRCFQPKGKNKN